MDRATLNNARTTAVVRALFDAASSYYDRGTVEPPAAPLPISQRRNLRDYAAPIG